MEFVFCIYVSPGHPGTRLYCQGWTICSILAVCNHPCTVFRFPQLAPCVRLVRVSIWTGQIRESLCPLNAILVSQIQRRFRFQLPILKDKEYSAGSVHSCWRRRSALRVLHRRFLADSVVHLFSYTLAVSSFAYTWDMHLPHIFTLLSKLSRSGFERT